MTKKVILSFLLSFVLIVMVNSTKVMTFSGTPPTGRTGAPSLNPTAGTTCAGCHAGNYQPNSPSMFVVFDNGNQQYVPGETYDMTLTMNSPGQKRWGFSMVARDTDNTGTDVGQFMESATDVQVYPASTMNHVGQQNAPNNVFDSYTFSFQWQAPNPGVGDVTFFSVGNAANGTFGTTGDIIYTNNLTISEAPSAVVTLDLKVLLEGPYLGEGLMAISLWENQLIPGDQPFNDEPWNFNENISVVFPPNFTTDWLLMELRNADDNNVVEATIPVFVSQDGTVTDLEGNAPMQLDGVTAGDYFIVIRQRNHLDIISSSAVSIPGSYDFTTSMQQALGENQLSDLGDGSFAMKAGDFNGDGVITVGDFNRFQEDASFINGYFIGDVNLDRTVTIGDFNAFQVNSGAIGVNQIRF